jgi:trimeric autotransporter adhesin
MKSPIFFSKNRGIRFWVQALLIVALSRIVLLPPALYANPTGEQVVGGVAGFNRPDAATLIVNQNTDRAVINWNSFSIANGELTRFVQPSSSSAVLNRVVTANPSAIYGTLQANGNVYLINPGGVLVGAGGLVNTASFVASTHDMNTEEFMKGGQLNFQGSSDASVINQGNITAREGDVFLIAKEVKNEGQLMAKDGTVGMVSGTEVSLQAIGQGNFKVRLMAAEKDPTSPRTSQGEGGASKGSVEIVNEGVIQAANAVLEAKGSYLPMAIKNTGVIEATGLVVNGDGSVTLTGGEGDILNTGVVAALQRSLDGQKETGGSIMMTAKNVTSDFGSTITAAGKDGGGTVKLRSADTTILRGSIEVVGTSESAKGGKVQLLGEKVGMFESAKVDASGGAGGGQVLVGGDYLGKNSEVPNAKAVVMAPTAEIRADAKISGDGGKVILWSDDYTGFFGKVTALGGAEGGNGGFVETSSKMNLQAFGAVNASASKGSAGMWLLDPGSITIDSTGPTTPGGFSGANPLVFTAPSDPSVVLNSDITAALNQGTSVTIQTGTGAEYDITVSAPIAKTLDNATTLTLDATGAITIDADITSIANELNMNFNADSNDSGAGSFNLNANLLSNGGNVTVTASGVELTGTINTLKTFQMPVTAIVGGTYGYDSITGIIAVPIVTVNNPTVSGGIAATATAVMGLQINTDPTATIQVINGGSGYATVNASGKVSYQIPKVVIKAADGATGAGASATAVVDTVVGSATFGQVTGILVTQSGAGYTSAPQVTFQSTGGVGDGATASIDSTQGFEVVNLAFDGAGASVSVPSYGVGYTAAPSGVTFNLGTASATLGLSSVAGNVVIQPSVVGAPISVGGLVDFVSAPALQQITVVGTTGTIQAGTITVGRRDAGDLTVSANIDLSTLGNGGSNFSLVSGGKILGPGGISAVTLGSGLLTLSSAGNITDDTLAQGPFTFDSARVAAVTEGTQFNLSSSQALTQLQVTTAGTTATQNISDGGNLNYLVTESGGDTSLNNISVTGSSPLIDTIDFRYVNTAGDITLSAGTVNIGGATTITSGGSGYITAPVVSFTTSAGGVAPTATTTLTAGVVTAITITSAGTGVTGISIAAPPASTPTAPTSRATAVVAREYRNVVPASSGPPANPLDFELRAPNGTLTLGRQASIFSGGGNLTLASQTIILSGATTLGSQATGSTAPNSGDFSAAYGVLNAFQSDGTTFGTYDDTPVSSTTPVTQEPGVWGRVSGVGGVLTLEPLSPTGAGQEVYITQNAFLYPNAYTISMYETMLLEAPAIRIGGAQAGNIRIEPLDTERELVYIVDGQDTDVAYIPRYFENPFFNASVPTSEYTPTGANVSGVSHVAGVSVSLVSGRGGVSNQPDADISVTTLGMTGVDEALFDGRGGANANYAASESGSDIFQIAGRTGRTVLDQTIGNGGDYSFYIGGGISVVDGRTVTGGASSLTSSSAATASTTVAGGQVVSIAPNATGYQYNYDPVVTIYGGGIQEASARALVSSSGTLDRVVPQIIGLGYTSAPLVTFSGGGGSGAAATAFVNSLGQLSPFEVDSTPTYSYAPTIQIFGSGTGAVARPILSNGTSGTLTGVQIVDPGKNYTSVSAIVLSGGGVSNSQNQAQVRLASGYDPNSTGRQITPIYVSPLNTGSGYTSEPTVTLSGGGIQVAQAKAMVDVNPGSNTRGQVIGYQITNPGQGYKTAPSVAVGQGQAFGNFGEYGISTEQVDQNRSSGNILVENIGALNARTGQLLVNAPIRTGDALGVGGLNATSGSILLNIGAQIVANPDLQADGVLITGDASIVGSTGSYGNASSGSVTITAYGIANTSGSSLEKLTGSSGLPIQIGTATGGINNIAGSLNARATDRLTDVNGAGDLLIYAPAPGEIETAAGGQPIDPNHPTTVPRTSNDLYLSGLQTDLTYTDSAGETKNDESLVTVEVGAFEGKLTLLQYAPSQATATLGVTTSGSSSGTVTLITPSLGGALYSTAPTVVITGGGNIQADATASVSGGQVTAISVASGGLGYSSTGSSVSITGGGGTGAAASVTVANGVVTGITMTSLGYGYTSLPTVTLNSPPGTAAATAILTDGQITSYSITNQGSGYSSAPAVYLQTSADPYNLDIDKLLLAADRFSILSSASSSLLITAATAVVAPYTNQRPVDLGTDTTGSTSFLSADLLRFAVNDLVLGRRQATEPSVGAGVITISQAVAASSLRIANGIALAGTRQIKDKGGTSGLAFENVVLDAGGEVSLTGTGNQIHYFSGVIRDSGLVQNATFTLSSSLTTSGTAKLPLTIGEVFLDGAFGTGQRFYQGITTQNGDIRIFADQLQQTRVVGFLDTTGGGVYGSGGLGANTAQVTLAPLTAGTGINLYATTPSSSSVLGLRIGNPQALGLELVEAKGLVIGSGSLRDIQVTDGGFGYQAPPGVTGSPPAVTITGGGGTGATAVSVLSDTGYLVNGETYYQVVGVRITNPGTGYTSAPEIVIADPVFGANIAAAKATIGAAGAITLNSNLEFNYLQYPNAPYQVTLASGSTGSITAGTSQAAGAVTSRVRVGALTLFDAGAVSLEGSNDVDVLSAVLTGSGTASNLSFIDIDAIQLANLKIPGNLTIEAGKNIGQVAGTTADIGGVISLVNVSGGISLETAGAMVLGDVTAGSGGTLTLTSNGSMSQDPGKAITAGDATLTAVAGSIILENVGKANPDSDLNVPGNDFSGTLNLYNSGANSISVSDVNSLTIGTLQMASFDQIPVATDWGSALATIDTSSGSSTYGQVTALTLTNPGAGYATTPTVRIDGGSGLGATGTVTVDLDATSPLYGKVTGITLTSGGSGYTFAPAVTLGTAVTLRAGGENEPVLNLDPIILNFTESSYQIPGAMVLEATSENNPTLAQLTLPGGGLTVGTGYSSFETSGSIVVTSPIQSGGYLNMKSETLNWDGLTIISAVQAVQLQPYRTGNELTQGPSVSIDLAGPLPGEYGVTAAQLQALDVSGGMVIVGNSKSTGGINIGATGAVDLSGINYSLGLAGLSGGVNFYNTLSLPAGSSFDLNTGSSVVNGFTTVDPSTLIIPDIEILNGTLSFSSSGGVGSLGQFLYTNVDYFGASAITGSVYLDNSKSATDTVITGSFTVSGSNSDFNLISGGGITANSAVVVGGQSFFMVGSGGTPDFIANNTSNGFSGLVTLAGPLGNVTINNSGMTLSLADLNISGNFWSQVTNGALVLGNTVVSGIFPIQNPPPNANFDVKAVGISASSLIVGGTTRLEAGTGDISLISSANDFGDNITILSSANTSLFMPNNTSIYLGAVQATGTFLLSTFGSMVFPWDDLATGNFDLESSQLSNFNVGTFSASASSNITLPQDFSFTGIPNLILTAGGSIQSTGAIQSSGVGMNAGSSIDVSGAIYSSNLNLTAGGSIQSTGAIQSSGVGMNAGSSIDVSGAIYSSNLNVTTGTYATLLGRNKISNLGNVVTSAGDFSFLNVQGLNLAGSVSVAGTADLTVAGQFYNYSGQSQPFAGTTGRAVVRSLSMMGGLPSQISALAGFTPSYNFTDPGTSRAMIYAVSPLAQFAPSGTTIAGVDLGGTQTGGGQFNTFLTGSDNLNWMISDFGRFDMPTVKPSGMDYILYPQRVEPETRTLPAATLGQLERELGRPPTLDEIQAREVAVRKAAMVRSGAILERSSFDAVEDEVDKQESAEVPAQMIDGGKPQAGGPSFAPSPASAGGASEGFGPQARKSQSVRQGSNGPILRSGPIRSVAQLRPAEPSQSGNISEASAQALKLDAKSVIEQERASAEVGIAPPIAAGR